MGKIYYSPIEGMRLCSVCGADISEELYNRTLNKFLQPMCYNCEREEILKGLNENKSKITKNK